MRRVLAALYGVFCYTVFFLSFLYLIGFVSDLLVPTSLARGHEGSLAWALFVDGALIALFGLQHSVMARPGFKRWWVRVVPSPIERSTYVLLSSLVLILTFWAWVPIPAELWSVSTPWLHWTLKGVSFAGFGVVLVTTFMIDHFDLFGLRQVALYLRQIPYTHHPLRAPGFYKMVRHPLYVGWLTAFWATPVMTAGHLLFAAGMTAYVLIAIVFEERDLVDLHGDAYVRYRTRTPMLVPFTRRGRTAHATGAAGSTQGLEYETVVRGA